MKIKTILLGESGVSKTRFLNYLRSNHMQNYCPTIGVDYVVYNSECNITLQIWDTSGSERFRGVVNNFLKSVDLCIFVYNSESSFQYMMNQIADVKKKRYGKRFCILSFNKPSLGKKVASKYGFYFFHVDIKKKVNCVTMLEELSRNCFNEQKRCNFLEIEEGDKPKVVRARESGGYCWLSFC